jgi:hypothetical protein
MIGRAILTGPAPGWIPGVDPSSKSFNLQTPSELRLRIKKVLTRFEFSEESGDLVNTF